MKYDLSKFSQGFDKNESEVGDKEESKSGIMRENFLKKAS